MVLLEWIGLVPCAGKGSRLGLPFSKEMFPNVYEDEYTPVITYTIAAMKKAGIKHIIFTLNPNKIDLLNFLGNGKQFDMNFTFCIHPIPLSLPESLYEAIHLIQDKNILFAMPDTYVQPNDFLKTLKGEHSSDINRAVTLACFLTRNPNKFGMVDFNGNQVLEIIDKPTKSILKWMWGAMAWGPEFTNELRNFVDHYKKQGKTDDQHINKKGELILSNTLTHLIHELKVFCHLFKNGVYI